MFNKDALAVLDPEDRRQALALLQKIGEAYERNPLERFHACPVPCGNPNCQPHPKQHDFLRARTPIQAAFAGNRFGKTSALTVKSLCQCLDDDLLPERLRQYRIKPAPAHGRIVGPDLGSWLYGVLLPEMRKWCPDEGLRGGTFDKAWDKVHRILTFANGSTIQFLTYEMDLDKFGGAAKDFMGYDEPPPESIRIECRMRLMDRDGFEMFAMTPLMGIGWIYRSIFLNKDDPHITVVRAAIHDNPHLDKTQVEMALNMMSPDERKSREYGDFAHFGGMVYPGGFEDVTLKDKKGEEILPSPKQLEGHEIICGIDPGLKVAAFVWVAFDRDNKAFVIDEATVEEGTPIDYAQKIRRVNSKWQIRPYYVIDPSARNRSLINAESIEAELSRQGIDCGYGQNQVLPGLQQIRRRMQEDAFKVSKECRRLRREALEYRQDVSKTRQEGGLDDGPSVGEFKVVKQNDHHLDALRYACMERPWYPIPDIDSPEMGYRPGVAPSADWLESQVQIETAPMGSLS